MDPKLWRELEAWSQEEMRSVNSQIEYLLKQAVQKRSKGPIAPNESEPPAPPENEPS